MSGPWRNGVPRCAAGTAIDTGLAAARFKDPPYTSADMRYIRPEENADGRFPLDGQTKILFALPRVHMKLKDCWIRVELRGREQQALTLDDVVVANRGLQTTFNPTAETIFGAYRVYTDSIQFLDEQRRNPPLVAYFAHTQSSPDARDVHADQNFDAFVHPHSKAVDDFSDDEDLVNGPLEEGNATILMPHYKSVANNNLLSRRELWFPLPGGLMQQCRDWPGDRISDTVFLELTLAHPDDVFINANEIFTGGALKPNPQTPLLAHVEGVQLWYTPLSLAPTLRGFTEAIATTTTEFTFTAYDCTIARWEGNDCTVKITGSKRNITALIIRAIPMSKVNSDETKCVDKHWPYPIHGMVDMYCRINGATFPTQRIQSYAEAFEEWQRATRTGPLVTYRHEAGKQPRPLAPKYNGAPFWHYDTSVRSLVTVNRRLEGLSLAAPAIATLPTTWDATTSVTARNAIQDAFTALRTEVQNKLRLIGAAGDELFTGTPFKTPYEHVVYGLTEDARGAEPAQKNWMGLYAINLDIGAVGETGEKVMGGLVLTGADTLELNLSRTQDGVEIDGDMRLEVWTAFTRGVQTRPSGGGFATLDMWQ